MSLHAFTCSQIGDNLPLKVECIDVLNFHGKIHLVVGTTEGQLLIYDTSGDELKGAKQFQLSKKPILQLNTVEEHGLLLTLSDSIITVHTIPQVNPNQPLTVVKKSSGCVLYAINRRGGVLRLAVALKSRRLLLMQWDEGLSEFVEKKELSMPDQAKSLAWLGDNITVGFKSEYLTFDTTTSQIEDRSIEKGTTACTYLLPDGNVLEMHSGTTALILDPKTGKVVREHGITFNDAPTMLGYSFPYVLAVTQKGVEIRPYFESAFLHQSISLPNVKFVASDSGHNQTLGRRGPGVAYLAGRKTLWRLQPVSLDKQVESLKHDGAYQAALVLCEAVTDQDLHNRSQLIADCKLRIAYKSYLDGIYHQAFKYFAELAIDPLILLGLFGNCSWIWAKEAGPILPPRVQKVVASKYPSHLDFPKYNDASFKKALSALLSHLVAYRQQNQQLGLALPSDSTPWDDVDDVATLIDTSILLVAVQLNEKQIVSALLGKRDHHCHFKRCEAVLKAVAKHEWLIQMYYSKKQHEIALSYLKELSTKPVAAAFTGTSRTMDYLVALGPEWWELIKKYSEWVIIAAPQDAYKIFTVNRTKENALPPLEVLAHLKNVSNLFKGPDATSNSRHLITKYLEHTINVMGCEIPEIHNELVFCYFREVFALKQEVATQALLAGERPRLSQYVVAGSEPGPLGIARSKLIKFLQNSSCYNPPQIHAAGFALEENAMFEEKAILLSKDGQHSAALKVIIHQMKEPSKAEEYCAQHYHSKDGADVYLDLFRVLIEPQPDVDDTTLNLNAAVDLLSRHSNQIEVGMALELLPPSTPLKNLEAFFQNVLRNKNQTLRENQVVLNVCKTESMRVTSELYKLRNQSVKILPETTCKECKKRIGEAVFAVLDGKVVHYRCFPQIHQQSSLGGYNFTGAALSTTPGSSYTGSYTGSYSGQNSYLASQMEPQESQSYSNYQQGSSRYASTNDEYGSSNPFGASDSASRSSYSGQNLAYGQTSSKYSNYSSYGNKSGGFNGNW